jgi:hypothetical protein
MRKLLLLAATAATTATMLAAVTTTAWAATPKLDVLTYTKVKGTDMAAKSALSASLKPGTSLTFGFAALSSGLAISCTKATFSVKVASNPARPGTAVTSSPALAVPTANCAVKASDNGQPVTGVEFAVTKVAFTFPATQITFGDAKNLPVTLGLPAKSTAKYAVELSLAFTADVPGVTDGSVACNYASAKLSGSYSDTGPVITFPAQNIGPLTAAGSKTNCSTTLPGVSIPSAVTTSFAATFGPVNDTSVKGSPHAFVN